LAASERQDSQKKQYGNPDIQPVRFHHSFMHYNQNAMRKKSLVFLLLLIITLTQTASSLPARLAAPSPYDLIAEVNAYRVANGYWALTPNSRVMAAAQGHADWIVATGQGGHIGANGSDETMRAYLAGYGGGASIKCDEAWASSASIGDAVYGAWSDWTHQEVMLNGWGNPYTDIGAGVADNNDGTYVFVLDICLVEGQGSSYSPGATFDPNATADLSNYIFSVTTATPGANGEVIHQVLFGQTLVTIAQAYGVTVADLRKLNGMAEDDSTIWQDQELIIRPASSAQSSTTIDPTTTFAPTFTPRPRSTIVLPTLAVTSSSETEDKAPRAATGLSNQTWGILLIILCGAGVVALVYFLFLKK
jgi:uncharacterized protein YkwD/LysM repeat protein